MRTQKQPVITRDNVTMQVDCVVYWQVPNKGTLDTTIGKTMGKKRYKSSTTTRNLRTIDKVLNGSRDERE